MEEDNNEDGPQEAFTDGNEELDPDVARNLDILKHLGLLGGGKTASKKKKARRSESDAEERQSPQLEPERKSLRIRGEAPDRDGGAAAEPPRAACSIRSTRHSYRDVVSGLPEVYSEMHVAALSSFVPIAASVAQPSSADSADALPLTITAIAAAAPSPAKKKRSHRAKSKTAGFAGHFEPPEAVRAVLEAPIALRYGAPECTHCGLRLLDVVHCCEKQCAHGPICRVCLWKRYAEAPYAAENAMEAFSTWRCPSCRGVCNCTKCRESKGWGAISSDVLPECLAAGFPSIAHWLILRRVGQPLASDLTEGLPNRGKRGRPVGGGGDWLRRLKRVQRTCPCVSEPILLSAGKVVTLGVVSWRPTFFTPDYVFPVGYHIQRLFNVDNGVNFTIDMSIRNGGDRPEFVCFALDNPEAVFQGTVSSAPLLKLLEMRGVNNKAVSGPRFMYLDDVMVRAAIHAQCIEQFVNNTTPETYRFMSMKYGPLVVRRGSFIACRQPEKSEYVICRAMHDAMVLKFDPNPTAIAVEFYTRYLSTDQMTEDRRNDPNHALQQSDGNSSSSVAQRWLGPMGSGSVPTDCLFFVLEPQHIARVCEMCVELSVHAPDLAALSNL